MRNFQHSFIGGSAAVEKTVEFCKRAARCDAPVLIEGESGTGKEVLARAIHENSRRRGRSCITVNCATLRSELLVSELFGYEKGAYTGADRQKIGKFEFANSGTLFLDEIGDMDVGVQPQVLRAVEYGCVDRLGGRESVPVDVRLIAATHKDLIAACRDGLFRKDLYYRLNILHFRIPPLRERAEDVPLLIRHFIERFGSEIEPPVRAIELEAEAELCKYAWPGNVRQLRNVIHRVILMGDGGTIRMRDLEKCSLGSEAVLDAKTDPGTLNLDEAAFHAQRQCLAKAHEIARGDRDKIAKILGINKTNIARLLQKFGLGYLKMRQREIEPPEDTYEIANTYSSSAVFGD